MPNIFTNNFGVFITDIIEKSIRSNTTFFAFAAKSTQYTNEAFAPDPGTSYGDQTYKLHDEMIFAKMITPSDIARVVKNKPWETNKVYSAFTDSLADYKNKDYFVSTVEGNVRSVFVCLDNNGGKPSTNMPIRSQIKATDTLYKMSDGYVWKYLFSVGVKDFNKFGSEKYIPIIKDTAVSNNAVAGAIDNVVIKHPGMGYNKTTPGVFKNVGVGGNNRKHYILGDKLSANTDYYNGSALYITENAGQGQLRVIEQYGEENGNRFVVLDEPFTKKPTSSSAFEITPNVKVTGDGEGFKARAVTSNTSVVTRIEVVERGKNYTFANAKIDGNSGVLDTNGVSVFSSDAVVDVVVPPVGGLGKDVNLDLSANKIVFSSEFVGSELPVTSFRKIGILVDPVFDNIHLRVSNTANFTLNLAVKTSDGLRGVVTGADTNENIIYVSNLNGPIKANTYISAVEGIANSKIESVITDYTKIDNRTVLTLTSSTTFQKGELVTQEGTDVVGYVDTSTNEKLYLTEVKGKFAINNNIIGKNSGSVATISKVGDRILSDNSGKIIYVENVLPVTRTANTTEHLKMVMEF